MPKLVFMESREPIGVISDQQLKFLVDQLVEEDREDRDYYISRDTMEMLKENDADPALLKLLAEALGDKDEMDIAWE